MLKKEIEEEIVRFAKAYDGMGSLPDKWRTPLVGFADAGSSGFPQLKELVHPDHMMPQDILPEATVVISYFLPFTEKIYNSNKAPELPSDEWADSYWYTNEFFNVLNKHLIEYLAERGYKAAYSPNASVFKDTECVSRWSQRHIARLAGLGTFGINNMLITDSGCCGRYCSLVTNLDVETDAPKTEEYCLYKKNNSCGLCVKKCPAHALTPEGFDRFVCHDLLQKNGKLFPKHIRNGKGVDVCGKCLIELPCTAKRP